MESSTIGILLILLVGWLYVVLKYMTYGKKYSNYERLRENHTYTLSTLATGLYQKLRGLKDSSFDNQIFAAKLLLLLILVVLLSVVYLVTT